MKSIACRQVICSKVSILPLHTYLRVSEEDIVLFFASFIYLFLVRIRKVSYNSTHSTYLGLCFSLSGLFREIACGGISIFTKKPKSKQKKNEAFLRRWVQRVVLQVDVYEKLKMKFEKKTNSSYSYYRKCYRNKNVPLQWQLFS